MTKSYEVTNSIKFFNWIMRTMIGLGFAPESMYVLTVPGRKSGKAYSTPVSLIEEGSKRWLVSPYGEVNWVRNARAAGGKVKLTRGRRSEVVSLVELGPQGSAPILKKYYERESFAQPYFDIDPGALLIDFEREAPRHPVFRIGS